MSRQSVPPLALAASSGNPQGGLLFRASWRLRGQRGLTLTDAWQDTSARARRKGVCDHHESFCYGRPRNVDTSLGHRLHRHTLRWPGPWPLLWAAWQQVLAASPTRRIGARKGEGASAAKGREPLQHKHEASCCLGSRRSSTQRLCRPLLAWPADNPRRRARPPVATQRTQQRRPGSSQSVSRLTRFPRTGTGPDLQVGGIK